MQGHIKCNTKRNHTINKGSQQKDGEREPRWINLGVGPWLKESQCSVTCLGPLKVSAYARYRAQVLQILHGIKETKCNTKCNPYVFKKCLCEWVMICSPTS